MRRCSRLAFASNTEPQPAVSVRGQNRDARALFPCHAACPSPDRLGAWRLTVPRLRRPRPDDGQDREPGQVGTDKSQRPRRAAGRPPARTTARRLGFGLGIRRRAR